MSVEAAPLAVGEPIFFLGATTGVAEQTLSELHGPDGQPAESVAQGNSAPSARPASSAAATSSTNSSPPKQPETRYR
ncbi:MAG: hypothetical protein ACLUYV_03235 [Alistipes shahii]